MTPRFILHSTIAAAFAVGYLALPYWSAYQLKSGIEAGDVAAVSRRVDWPSLKESVRRLIASQMRLAMTGIPPGDEPISRTAMAMFANTVQDRAVDFVASPQGLISMIRGGSSSSHAPIPALNSQVIKRFGIVGLTRFEFVVGPPGPADGYVLGIMELRGVTWQLTGIEALPALMRETRDTAATAQR